MPTRPQSFKSKNAIKHEEIRKQINLERVKKNAVVYASKRWKTLRKIFLQDNPLCAYCQLHDEIRSAQIVHHKIYVRDDDELIFDYDNLESLCKSCHSKLHSNDAVQFGRLTK